MAQCLVQGTWRDPGFVDGCGLCDPAASSALVPRADDTACAAGRFCRAGQCTAGCVLDGGFVADGTADPLEACRQCRGALSTSGFSPAPEGVACGSGQYCSGGSCGPGCLINGALVLPGAVQPGDACSSCVPALSTTAWSTSPNGTRCGAQQACAAGSCQLGCFVSGALAAPGALNPANACEACAPALSVSTWTRSDDGAACGGGQVCAGGTCAAACFIFGAVRDAGTPNPTNACASCEPPQSTTGWSPRANGASCGAGSICDAGSCCTQRGAACLSDGGCCGPDRCQQGACAACRGLSESCAASSDCCAASTNAAVCQTGACRACVGRAQPCAQAPCCGGLACAGPNTTCCTQQGQPCTFPTECCGGRVCGPVNGVNRCL